MAAPIAPEGAFVVELERFQGPLDLLLHLIREQDIDIFDIPISRITGQFLEAIESVDVLGLDRAGEFLEMAATLIRIKVQMLLPRRADETGEVEDPRAELVRRLLEYEHFREVARRLESAELERIRHFRRGHIPPRPRAENRLPDALEVEWAELWAAVLTLDERVRAPAEHRLTPRLVSIEEKMELILRTLGERSRVEFRRLVEAGDRLHAVVTLLAGLELAKERHLLLRQQAPFAALWFFRRRRKGGSADVTDR
jgi:segregation and condensation protein A